MLILLLACRPDADTPTLLSVEVPEDQPLALDVAWAASASEALWLERTLADGTVLKDAVDPAGGSARAFGHPALSTVAVALIDGEGARSEPISATLGNLTPEVPSFSMEGSMVDPGELLVVSTFLLPTGEPEDVLVAIDHSGQVVWFHAETETLVYRPDLLLTDSGWWSLRLAALPEGDPETNTITRYDLTGAVLDEVAVPNSHHVFTETDAGLAWVVEEGRETEQGPWLGDVLIVDGQPLTSLWDDLPSEALMASTSEDLGRRFCHTNGLHHSQGTFLMTLGAQDAVLEVDAATGEPLRWLGSGLPEGLGLEAVAWSAEEAMVLPHMAAWTAEGTLLLTGSDADFRETWATEFAVEGDALVPVWTHGRGEGLGAFAMGHAERLDDGDTLVNYGTAGTIQRVSLDGEVEGEIAVELGRIIGRSTVTGPLPLLIR